MNENVKFIAQTYVENRTQSARLQETIVIDIALRQRLAKYTIYSEDIALAIERARVLASSQFLKPFHKSN